MSDDALEALARAAGIAIDWTDYRGRQQRVGADTLRHLLGALGLPAGSPQDIDDSAASLAREAGHAGPLITADAGAPVPLRIEGAAPGRPCVLVDEHGRAVDVQVGERGGEPALRAPDQPGYYRLQLGDSERVLAVAPAHCTAVPPAHDGAPPWGLVAQLYSLADAGDMGLATYAMLGRLAERAATHGADALAVSPTHAMFSADPARCSPYAPSSRLFLNALHIDPVAAFGRDAVAEALARLQLQEAARHLESHALVDWSAAGSLRLSLLRELHGRLIEQDPGSRTDFEGFRDAGGEALESHARFELVHAQLGGGGWHDWPEALRDPAGAAVRRLAAEHPLEIRFHTALQWLAQRQLAGAHAAARGAGMQLGLVADLAVGADPGGSHAWSRQQEILAGTTVGAPPDELAPQGQGWGLAAFSPIGLRQNGYHAFIELLRATMAMAGGLRIDHIMGLQRLWLIPDGGDSSHGAYLRYPLDDLLRLVALESWRHRCVIVGEDLGTVDPALRERLAAHAVLGMSVLYFERDDRGYTAPARWRRHSVAMTSTHDLPTLAGWWEGRDLALRHELGLDGDAASHAQALDTRAAERAALWRAIGEGPAGHADAAALTHAPDRDGFVDAAIAHVGSAASALALVPLEDIVGTTEAPNLPGTTSEHPNWRRRLPSPTAEELDRPARAQRLAQLAAARRSRT